MKNCLNCRYSRDVGPYLACYGQKNAPEVDLNYVCEDWKQEYATATNADRIRAMTDEEIEDWYWWMHKVMMSSTNSRVFVHDWLKQEVNDGK